MIDPARQGHSLRNQPLNDRKMRLRYVVPRSVSGCGITTIERDGQRLFLLVCEHNLEGIVAKRKFDPCLHRIPNTSTCLAPWQQRQRVVAANPLEIAFRKAELHQAFSCLGEGHERIVAVEQNLCGWDEAG
jgi:hypothetical protein